MSLFTPSLTRDKIRLLKVIRSDPLLCSLELFNFDETLPKYVCLSYTWGSPVEGDRERDYLENKKLTVVNSVSGGTVLHHFFVGRNLYKALEQLTHSYAFEWLWVDAICINQQDITEKSAEVQRMSSIYTRATLTVAWLGCHDDEFEALVEVWNWLTATCGKWLETHKEFPGLVWEGNEAKCEASGRALTRETLQPLVKFFHERRYLRRAWVAQEVVLPKSLLFIYGGGRFMEKSFKLVTGWIDHNASELVPALSAVSTTEAFGVGVNAISQLFDMRSLHHNDRGKVSEATLRNFRNGFGCSSPYTYKLAYLEHTLWRLRFLEAFDQRDLLFSLCGFVSALDWSDLNDGPLIAVDYAKSVEDVYRDFAKILIQNLPFLTVLAFLHPGDREDCSKLPSYCPDWSKHPEFLRSFGMQSHAWAQPDRADSFFDAYPTRIESFCAVEFVGDELHLFAGRCGIVETHTVPFTPRETVHEGWDDYWVCDYLLFWLRNVRDLGPKYLGVYDIMEALTENCFAGFPIYENAETPENYTVGFVGWLFSQVQIMELAGRSDPASFGHIWNKLARLLDQLEGRGGLTTREELNRWKDKPRDRRHHIHRSPQEERLSRRFELVMLDVISENNCYFNMTGGYIGTGPTTMQLGDEIWIPCRGRVPLVLRPLRTTGTYRIIGEAYIQNGMRGELVQRQVMTAPERIAII